MSFLLLLFRTKCEKPSTLRFRSQELKEDLRLIDCITSYICLETLVNFNFNSNNNINESIVDNNINTN